MSLNSALHVAGRSLEIFTTGIEVSGNNISNSSTPGYIREQLNVAPSNPYRNGNFVIGSGAEVIGVRQQIDLFLEKRIYASNSELTASQQRVDAYNQLQSALGELGDQDLSTGLNNFINSVSELVNQPESNGLKTLVIQQGEALAQQISDLRNRVDTIRSATNTQVDTLVGEANDLIDNIADLNRKILRLESAGLLQSDAGDLRSQRLIAINRLSEIVPISVTNKDNGSVDVYLGNDYLVFSQQTQHLESFLGNDRGILTSNIKIKENQLELNLTKGEISGLLQGRDDVLGGFVDTLDQFTGAVINEFNKIHSSGEGTKGYSDITSSNYVTDSTAALNLAGLNFNPKHGTFDIKVYNKDTGLAETKTINIDLDGLGGNDTSLEDLRTALDAITNVDATIDGSGKLRIKTADGFEVRFGNDTSGVLASLGVNTFFTGFDSATIGVNQNIKKEPGYFATGIGGGAGDNRNAVKLAQFIDQPSSLLNNISIDDFYNQLVSDVAQSSASEKALYDGLQGYQSSLQSQKQQVSGVSIDEEAIKILQFQHAYQAAAKIITTVDELFNVLLSSI